MTYSVLACQGIIEAEAACRPRLVLYMILYQFTHVKLQTVFASIFLPIQQKCGCSHSQMKVLYTGIACSPFPQGNKLHWYKHVHTGIPDFTLGKGYINVTER